MNKLIIYEYMNRIKRKDIINFGMSQGIRLDDYEVDVIFNYIKNDRKRIFSNPEGVIDDVKYKVSDLTYKKILELYNKYKDKIS